MRSMEKKVYLGILVCLLVSMIGTSFAYFISSATAGTGTGPNTEGSASDMLHMAFDSGTSSLTIQDAFPGNEEEKDFSVKVKPTSTAKDVTYAIVLNISSNTFVKCSNSNYKGDEPKKNACVLGAQELVYTLYDENDTQIGTGDLLEESGKITLAKVTKSNLTSETTYNYKLKVTFKNTNADQNHNMNKEFVSTVGVEFAQAN